MCWVFRQKDHRDSIEIVIHKRQCRRFAKARAKSAVPVARSKMALGWLYSTVLAVIRCHA